MTNAAAATPAIPKSTVPEAVRTIVAGMDSRDTEPIADLRGSMEDGYDAQFVDEVLSRMSEFSGLRIVCVWDYHDAFGVGGDSTFFVDVEGRFHHCAGDLWRWLNDNPKDPDAVVFPGVPASWVGQPSDLNEYQLPYREGHNYARSDLLDSADTTE